MWVPMIVVDWNFERSLGKCKKKDIENLIIVAL